MKLVCAFSVAARLALLAFVVGFLLGIASGSRAAGTPWTSTAGDTPPAVLVHSN